MEQLNAAKAMQGGGYAPPMRLGYQPSVSETVSDSSLASPALRGPGVVMMKQPHQSLPRKVVQENSGWQAAQQTDFQSMKQRFQREHPADESSGKKSDFEKSNGMLS